MSYATLHLQRICPLYVAPPMACILYYMQDYMCYMLYYMSYPEKLTRPQCVHSVAQELLENKQGLPLPQLMDLCNRQVESDSMVMALRAIAAAQMMACEEGRSWATITRDMELAFAYR